MPTIDDLPAANSVSDSDETVLSQNGNTVKATRAQIVSGLQPALYLPQGSLLGRISAGTGAPETLTIGANLAINAGVITAPAPYEIAQSANGNPVQPTDLVPLAQGGQNAMLNYAAFMSGLGSLPGINASALSVTALGAPGGRSLAAIAADAIPVEAFGAVGDGQTDDTAAFSLALAAGRPLRLDGRVYIVNGQLAITDSTALLGVAQNTVIRRLIAEDPGAWISVAAASLTAFGIVFDAGNLAAVATAAVSVGPGCVSASFVQCGFINAYGTAAGSGLALQCATNASHSIIACILSGNGLHGLSAAGGGALTISGCAANSNGGYGISIGNGIAAVINDNQCNGNQSGISLGGWNITPISQSRANPTEICRNACSGNSLWGLALACTGALIAGNTLGNNGGGGTGGGMLARLSLSLVSGNMIANSGIGLDCRGSSASQITGNCITNTTSGILAGGAQNLLINGNFLNANLQAITVSGIEPSIGLLPTAGVSIDDNWIGFTLAQGGGIFISDGAQTVSVTGNAINGWGSANVGQALWVHTDSAILSGNSWNHATRFPISAGLVANLQTLVVPDVADSAFVLAAPPNVQSILTTHQLATLGQIMFIRVLSGGTGYSQAQIGIAGGGAGAHAQAIIENGAIIWITVTSPGSGYGDIGAAAQVSITGDGAGATAQAFVGLPVIEGKRLRLACNTQLRLVQAGSNPPQTSWSGFDTTIPAMGAVEIEGTYGQWRAVQSPPVDYLLPTGNGGAVLQSVAGADLTVRPSSGGLLQIASAAEPTGYVASVGRGSPEGSVSAPPGSDFRNLDGGGGNTFWIKTTGTGNQGWVAVA
jgi:hypothetical protein